MPRGKSQVNTNATVLASLDDSDSDILLTGASKAENKSPALSNELSLLLVKITEAFSTTFNASIDRLIQSMESRVNTRLDVQETNLFDYQKRLDKCEKANRDLAAENSQLRDNLRNLSSKIEVLSQALDDQDQYSRNSNLLIHGVPLPNQGLPETDLCSKVTGLLNSHLGHCGLSLADTDVSVIHRMNRSTPVSNQASSLTTKPPPVIIQFCSKRVRAHVLNVRKHLKGKGITVTEQLTPKKAELLKKSNLLVNSQKLQAAWSSDGRILVKSLNNRTIVINSQTDLEQF